MLYYNFKNYQEFQELFGVRTVNGKNVRRNKILLAMYKDKFWFANHVHKTWRVDFLEARSVQELKRLVMNELNSIHSRFGCVHLGCFGTFVSTKYATDELCGICEDEDVTSVRYILLKTDKVYKMKASKMMGKLIEEHGVVKMVPEQVKNFIREEFQTDWEAYAASAISGYTLHVNDSFSKIYDSDCCRGNFHSCMTDAGFEQFYADSVEAKAAYLTNEDNEIVARCVVFTNVHDESGNTYRLAERQYATSDDLFLKKLLVEKLKAGNNIDGYKRVGADCHAANAFILNSGEPLEDTLFIDMAPTGECGVPYQDSFKFFDSSKCVAYNTGYACYTQELTDTDGNGYAHVGQVQSEWYGEWIDEDYAVYAEMRQDWILRRDSRYCQNTHSDELFEDVVELHDGEYAYYGAMCEGYEGVEECPNCDQYYLSDDAYYSDLTGKYYCCEDCRREAEEEYADNNGYVWDGDSWVKAQEETA